MGSKLTSIRERSNEAKEGVENGLEKAKEDADEMAEVRSALERVPENADDDIVKLKDTVEQGSVSEAVQSMESNARAELDSARSTGGDAINEATDTAQANREAAEAYSGVGDTRFGGGAADAQSQAETGADELEGIAEETEADLERGDDEYSNFLSQIQG